MCKTSGGERSTTSASEARALFRALESAYERGSKQGCAGAGLTAMCSPAPWFVAGSVAAAGERDVAGVEQVAGGVTNDHAHERHFVTGEEARGPEADHVRARLAGFER